MSEMQTVNKETEEGQHVDIVINDKTYRLKCVVCGHKKWWRSECHRWVYCCHCSAVCLDVLDDIIDMEGATWNIPKTLGKN